MNDDLDLTRHFSAAHKVSEPQHDPVALSRIDDLGAIGDNKLKTDGFYARIVSAQGGRGRARLPGEVTILVIEDDDGTALVIEKVLRNFGYLTRRARSRAEIVQRLGEKPMPDMLLLDVMLPDVNGFDVLNRVRGHPLVKNIPVLMLTSKSDRKDIARGLALGADGYLTKPALPSTLIDAVQAIMAG